MNSLFQTILLVVFGFTLVIGVLIFSGVLPGFKETNIASVGKITLWGTIPRSVMDPILYKVNNDYKKYFLVNYVQKDAENFDRELVEALALGKAPEVIIGHQELLLKERNKLLSFSFKSIPLRDYLDTYIDGGKIFLNSEGAYALPIFVDPLMFYYNKDYYVNANLLLPPSTWEQFVAIQPKLTVVDELNNIRQSATALGTHSNIMNFKDILALLIMQAGNPLVEGQAPTIKAVMAKNVNYSILPAEAAVNFFLQFADPTKVTYSWNRSLPMARDAFVGETLVSYFGPASDFLYLKNKNPHLNFDVAEVPQQGDGERLTLGRLYGVAVVKNSARPNLGIQLARVLSGQNINQSLSEQMYLPSARRDLLNQGTSDPYKQIFYRSAIVSRGWLDVDDEKTTTVFRSMIDNIASGRLKTVEALRRADEDLNLIFNGQ